MQKQPEEGQIWEWRAFGSVSKGLMQQIRALPIRLGIEDLWGEDIYFVSPTNDQNVKLRLSSAGWMLKFKILLEHRSVEGIRGNFELYNESSRLAYSLPVQPDQLSQAADLLSVSLQSDEPSRDQYQISDLSEAFAHSSPPVSRISVTKRRSQYEIADGWIESAEVSFPVREIESISVHAPSIESAQAILKTLRIDNDLEPMNYVHACRLWGE